MRLFVQGEPVWRWSKHSLPHGATEYRYHNGELLFIAVTHAEQSTYRRARILWAFRKLTQNRARSYHEFKNPAPNIPCTFTGA